MTHVLQALLSCGGQRDSRNGRRTGYEPHGGLTRRSAGRYGTMLCHIRHPPAFLLCSSSPRMPSSSPHFRAKRGHRSLCFRLLTALLTPSTCFGLSPDPSWQAALTKHHVTFMNRVEHAWGTRDTACSPPSAAGCSAAFFGDGPRCQFPCACFCRARISEAAAKARLTSSR